MSSEYIQVFALIFLGAMVSTIPVGPVNLALIALALKGQRAYWFLMSMGIIIADFLVAMICKYASDYIDDLSVHEFKILPLKISNLAVALVFILMGWYMRRGSKESLEITAPRLSKKKALAYGVSGFVATLCEPGLPFFWISWWWECPDMSFLETKASFLFVFMAIFMGDMVVFSGYSLLVRKIPIARSGQFLKGVQSLFAYILFLAAGYFLVRFLA